MLPLAVTCRKLIGSAVWFDAVSNIYPILGADLERQSSDIEPRQATPPVDCGGMPTEVLATSRADQQIASLTCRHARIFDGFLDDLAARGCTALAYRLSGESPIDHTCVKYLRESLRVVVAFESPRQAWIILVGHHDDLDPVLNVYAELYRLRGVEPSPDAGRDKPPCCEQPDGQPPVLGDAVTKSLTATRNSGRAVKGKRGQRQWWRQRHHSEASWLMIAARSWTASIP